MLSFDETRVLQLFVSEGNTIRISPRGDFETRRQRAAAWMPATTLHLVIRGFLMPSGDRELTITEEGIAALKGVHAA